MSQADIVMKGTPQPVPRRRPKIYIPRRDPSLIIPSPEKKYITPDKTTCRECPCFPEEEPYRRPKKLLPCQQTPLTLYELAATVVDSLKYPAALNWSESQVANWMADAVGFPEYRDCILDNHIDGMRLLMLEDPSKLPAVNIHHFDHIKKITSKVREEYSTDFVRFVRSVGLPPRTLLAHGTWFHSRTGPPWGIRQNWTRSGVLRWMKIIMPEPVHLDHWDLVWYQKPDFPKVLFGKIPPAVSEEIPHYRPVNEHWNEFLARRKFIILKDIPEHKQFIWVKRTPKEFKETLDEMKAIRRKKKTRKPLTFLIDKDSRLYPKQVSTQGLRGRDLLLARRKMSKPKYLPQF